MKSIRAEQLPRGLLALLQRVAAGRLIYVPVRGHGPRNRVRDAEIRRERRQGASVPDLAVEFSLSESRIWEICRGLHPDRTPGNWRRA